MSKAYDRVELVVLVRYDAKTGFPSSLGHEDNGCCVESIRYHVLHKQVKTCLMRYERALGQMVNLEKSCHFQF